MHRDKWLGKGCSESLIYFSGVVEREDGVSAPQAFINLKISYSKVAHKDSLSH
jgi:hypothetical protein